MTTIADLWSKHPELPEDDLRSLLKELWLLVLVDRSGQLSFRDHCKRVLHKYRLEYQFLAMQAFRDRGTPFAFDESVLLRIQDALEKREGQQVLACVKELRRELKRMEWHRETKEIEDLQIGARYHSMVRGLVHKVVAGEDSSHSVESINIKPRIEFEDGWIFLDGKQITNDPDQFSYVRALVDAYPSRLSQAEITEGGDRLQHQPPGKLNRDVRDNLPKKLRELIDTKQGSGSVLKPGAWTN